ncbi:class II aldolase/adducin family protein [Ohessyouella blattaphilus]|uniref:Class II aldolase/adducin family protein n=1 Tax=Ohessyouella blattaphilus TaxID=2949333 RepID=A0ABT1EI71_9FIRM|nr:class II aldolase/adducin family protein [Ohessyouella blattaphilus]MCP1110394.1 class II aldolase/adducin family protein [Ohessyouella blattaphilus]MCR8563788.1 class II aldolase/adducin family protein [Ohessyouella blattaphilus]
MNKKDAYKIKLFQDEVARGIHRAYEGGFLANEELGEVSVRDGESGYVFISIKPGTFYVSDPTDYHGSDMAVVTAEGDLVTEVTPPSEFLDLHLAVYRARPDVNAILHSYPVFSSLWAQRKENIPYVLAEQIEASTAVECVTMAPSKSEEYFAEVTKKLKQEACVLMYDFGALAVADNIDNAINNLAWIESVTKKYIMAEKLGEPIKIG